MALPCDVTDKAACEAASDVLVKAWGTIDILVNATSQAIAFACRGTISLIPHQINRIYLKLS